MEVVVMFVEVPVVAVLVAVVDVMVAVVVEEVHPPGAASASWLPSHGAHFRSVSCGVGACDSYSLSLHSVKSAHSRSETAVG